MDCTQVLESELDDSVEYTYKVKVAELKVNDDNIPIYSGSNRIGRDPEFCSVVFNNMTLSKEHAVIEVENRYSHLIYDLGSKNKTKLGKLQLKPHVRYQLMDKSEIQFGDLVVKYAVMSEEVEGEKVFAVIQDSDDEVIPGTPAPAVSKESTSSREDSPTIFQTKTESSVGYEETGARLVTDPNELLDEVIPGTPAPAVSKESTSSREDSPTIFQMETNLGYEETCARLVPDPNELRDDLDETNLLEENDKRISPVVASDAAGEVKDVSEKSALPCVSSDGDETDPEDSFSSMTWNPMEEPKIADATESEDKVIVEENSEKVVLQLENDRYKINKNVGISSELQSAEECEDDVVDLKEAGDVKDDDVLCIDSPVISPRNVLEEKEEVVYTLCGEDNVSKEEKNVNSTTEVEFVTDVKSHEICSEKNDKDLFKVPHGVQKESREIVQVEIPEEKKSEKQLESPSSVKADVPSEDDSLFEADTQIINSECNDSRTFKVPLTVQKENMHGNDGTDIEDDSCNSTGEDNANSSNADPEVCDENDLLYSAETQVLCVKQAKDNSCEIVSASEVQNEQIQEVVCDSNKDESTDREDAVHSDNVHGFIFDAPTQVNSELFGKDLEAPQVERNNCNVLVSSASCEVNKLNENPLESDLLHTGVNNSFHEAETQVFDVEQRTENSSDLPSTNDKKSDEKDDENVLEECASPSQMEKKKGDKVVSKDDASTQIVDCVQRDMDPLNSEDTRLTDQNLDHEESYVETNSKEKETRDTVREISEINVNVPKDVHILNKDFNSFKVPFARKKEELSKVVKNDKNVTNDEKVGGDESERNSDHDPFFDAPTQVINKDEEVSNLFQTGEGDKCDSLEEVMTSEQKDGQDSYRSASPNERNCGDAPMSNNIQSSSLNDDDDDSVFTLPTQVICKTKVDHISSSDDDTNEKTVSFPSGRSSNVEKTYSTLPSDEAKEGEKVLNVSQEERSETEETENLPRKDDALNDSFSEASSVIFPPSQVTTSQEEAKNQINNILNQLEDEEKVNGLPESSIKSDDQETEVSGNESTLNNSFFEAATQIAPIRAPEDSNSCVEAEETEDSGNEPVSDSSFFEAPTQIISRDAEDSLSQGETLDTEDNENEGVPDNLLSEVRPQIVPSRSGNDPILQEEAEETEDPRNSHALNNSHPKAPAEIPSFKASKELTPQEGKEEEEQEKKDTSENEGALNDSFFEAATQIAPCIQPEHSSFPAEAQETEDSGNEHAVINPLSETPSQIVPSKTIQDAMPQEDVDQVNTSLSRSSSYSSIHEAATQCIDDLDAAGQTLPVVTEAKLSTKDDEENKGNPARDSANETLQIQDNSRIPEALNDDVELVLPSTQELKTAAELCYGGSPDGEVASTSLNEASPVLHKRIRNKPGSRRGILMTDDLGTVKPIVARVSFAENLTNPSSSKTDSSSDIAGQTSEVVVSTSRRRLKLPSKRSINKPSVSEDVTDREDPEVEKSKKNYSKKSIQKDSESEDVSSDNKVEEKDDKRNKDHRKNVINRRNKTVKDSDRKEQSSMMHNGMDTGRPSRQRKMTWKAQENQDKSQSPDSKGNRDEASSPGSDAKSKIPASSPSDTNDGKARRQYTRCVKMKNIPEANSESKPAYREIPPETCTDSNLSPKRRKVTDPAPTPTNKDEKTKSKDKVEPRRSARASKTSTAKSEPKVESYKKEQTTLDKWCQSPVLSRKHKKTEDIFPVVAEAKKVEQFSRRSGTKHSSAANKSSDENMEFVMQSSVSHNKRKQETDISESPRKRRLMYVKKSSDGKDVENKTETSVSSVEGSELLIGCSAVRSRRKQNVDSSVSSIEQEKRGCREHNSVQDEKTVSTRRSRKKQSIHASDSPTSRPKLKSEETETQDEKKQRSQTSRPTNRRKTTSSSSNEQEKAFEELQKGRSKRSIPKIIPEEDVKPKEMIEKKRRQDSEICETPKKQKKIISTSSRDDQVENVNDNSRRRSNRATPMSNSFSSNVKMKDDADENMQDLVLQTSRNQRKARVTLPLVKEDETENKRGRSKPAAPASDSRVSKEELQIVNSGSQNLHTPPRTAKNRSTHRHILSTEKTDKKMQQMKNHKEAQSTESDGSFCGSPALSASGRKRKLKLTTSSTPVESDGQSSQGEGTPKRSSRLKHQVVHRIMFTGVACSEDEKAIITKLGGKIVQEVEECSILITDKIRRTLKLLCVMGQGKPIVSPDWIKKSEKSGQFLDPWDFIVKDKEAEKKFKFQLQKSLKLAASKKILEGFSVFVTPSVMPPPSEMKGIIEKSGGQFLSREPRVSEWPAQSFIISTPTDKKWNTKLKKTSVPIVSTEILLTGILQQKLSIKDHILKL